jgi:hypothetical protein
MNIIQPEDVARLRLADCQIRRVYRGGDRNISTCLLPR